MEQQRFVYVLIEGGEWNSRGFISGLTENEFSNFLTTF